MSFILVVVQLPDRNKHADIANWGTFQAIAKLESLKGVAGVFCINESAWIFDTRTALPEFGLVILQANELRIQSYVFQFDNESLRSHVASYPQSKKLEAFLALGVKKEDTC